MKTIRLPVYFHHDQLKHKPMYEWAFGKRLSHPETTSRAENILTALQEQPDRFDIRLPDPISLARLTALHNPDLAVLYQAASSLPKHGTYCPNVFPKRDHCAPKPTDLNHAGFYCFDSGTPLTSTTWMAAAWSASCARQAAEQVSRGTSALSYALCRPPGHHASRDLFGGYCYFNNAAIAAEELRRSHRRLAILDIDFHHGNGTQSLYYRDKSVLFLSIHGDPREFYPYFSGHAKEVGEGPGKGTTINLPIPSGCDGQEYFRVFSRRVVSALKRFRPGALVVSAGFDTYEKDPIGAFTLRTPDFQELGERIGKLSLPTVCVQEGGYCTDQLGRNVRAFLTGLVSTHRRRG